MSSAEVDEFAKNKLTPEYQEILQVIRELFKEQAPNASEVISYGSPSWKGKKSLAIVSHSKTHFTLAFTRGAEFKDEHGHLEGVGKTTRHIRIKTVDAVDKDAIRDYIKLALQLDEA